ELAARLAQLALEPLPLIEESGEPRRQLGRGRAEGACRLAQHSLLLLDVSLGRGAGQRLDAAHAGGDGALRDDLEEADIAGAADMRAAAQLDREGLERMAVHVGLGAHGDDAHLVAVFLAEERQRAGLDRLLRRHEPRRHLAVLADAVVDLALDDADVLAREGARLAEIEAQPVGRHERALLRHMLAQAPAQCLMQQMRHRVIGAERGAARLIDAQLDEVAELERAMRDAALMDEELAGALLRVAHRELAARMREYGAGVADLAAGFGVERRLVDEDGGVAARLGLFHRLAALDDGDDLALGDMRVIAQEFGGADLVAQLEPHLLGRRLAGADPALPRL